MTPVDIGTDNGTGTNDCHAKGTGHATTYHIKTLSVRRRQIDCPVLLISHAACPASIAIYDTPLPRQRWHTSTPQILRMRRFRHAGKIDQPCALVTCSMCSTRRPPPKRVGVGLCVKWKNISNEDQLELFSDLVMPDLPSYLRLSSIAKLIGRHGRSVSTSDRLYQQR